MPEDNNQSSIIAINQIGYLKNFKCLAEKCSDTCCKGWGMQVDPRHLELYREKAPEILETITSGETDHVMKRDAVSGFCVNLNSSSLCGIQVKRGTDFLPDACHFYPRITRKFGDDFYVMASMSCPEIARLALYENEDFDFEQREVPRLPGPLKDYLSESGLSEEAGRTIMAKCIQLADDKSTAPEMIISKLVWLAANLNKILKKDWPAAIDSLIANAAASLPAPEYKAKNPFNLLNILAGLAASTRKPRAERLSNVISSIENALGVRMNWEKMVVERVRPQNYEELRQQYYRDVSPLTREPLRRWIKASLTAATFPFGGLGNDPFERATIIAVRFATLNLAIMSNMQQLILSPQDTTILLAQSLSRFLDHLATPELSMACYQEAGWDNLSVLRGLVES